jgi:hypothetical protein
MYNFHRIKVYLIKGDTDNMAIAQQAYRNLEEFSFENYAELVPQELYDTLAHVFKTNTYGWKRKARILLRLKRAHQHVAAIEQELSDACGGRKATPVRAKVDIAREGIRKFLQTLEDVSLQKLCVKHLVSYNSFMEKNDKTGLMEALVDEMLLT